MPNPFDRQAPIPRYSDAPRMRNIYGAYGSPTERIPGGTPYATLNREICIRDLADKIKPGLINLKQLNVMLNDMGVSSTDRETLFSNLLKQQRAEDYSLVKARDLKWVMANSSNARLRVKLDHVEEGWLTDVNENARMGVDLDRRFVLLVIEGLAYYVTPDHEIKVYPEE